MKKYWLVLLMAALTLNVHAQLGSRSSSGSPGFSAAIAKLFGNNSSFSARIETQMGEGTNSISSKGTLSFSDSKSRYETDMTQTKSAMLTPEAVANMTHMGLDKMVAISRPDKKALYILYPNLKAYVEMPSQESDTSETDLKVDKTEIGKETVDGHPCVKNKVVISDNKGTKHEATTWNATDIKDFPIKIEQSEQGHTVTTSFTNIKIGKPDEALFAPPSDYKKYDTMASLMQQALTRAGAAGAAPAPEK